ncbi:hyaluronan and proteoglycan link protein 2 [Trichomycterus rosablanca]|uniref:hyaluronan and proteoglycan link protein 2 n=1 Tax=Trichomycterus rosablanca TaxID=2290929 RepID=UPI002F35C785
MNGAAFIVMITSLIWWTDAVYLYQNKDKNKELQYLLEPPVYAEITAHRRENVTLPCILQTIPSHYWVKWTKVKPHHKGVENILLITNGHEDMLYGSLGHRATLRRAHSFDISLRLNNLELQDFGQYRCELINGIEDESVTINLSIEGVVFPYQSSRGRYKLSYTEAKEACREQDATLATYTQLYRAWTEGLDWCNAGWLNDGTVHYPILSPRPACGKQRLPGIRSYRPQDRIQKLYDAFCFTSTTEGSVFFISGPLSFLEAVNACREKQASLARVGQLYSSWRFLGLDRCDGGWLQDGSVRFPIHNPREHCGGIPHPGVHSLGFPNKHMRQYGAYCYR